MNMKRPRVIITPEGEKWLRQGQMWMYRNNLAHLDDCENGDVVDIMTASGDYLGSGFVSLESHVIVRILTKRQELPIDRDFFRQRLEAAISYRLTVERDNFDNCRLVFGEADLLPGLTVDRYNDLLVCQITSFGM
ncbi:MAG: rRNA large subunit methyltransferase I, partial [bacterium]